MKQLLLGSNHHGHQVRFDLPMGNRHGLVAGATGTGKTVTLQVLAEQFSEAGVPVFATDVKGDLSGIVAPGKFNDNLLDRADEIGLESYEPQGYPVQHWDLFGKQGKQIRATVMSMNALLMARLLNLTPTQAGVLNVVYMVAEKRNMPFNTLGEFKGVLNYCLNHAESISANYGYLSASTVGIIVRGVTALEMQGGDKFFGIPEFDVHDLMSHSDTGLGTVNLLAADTLMNNPQLYAAFIMWLMQRLFATLPEVGDPDQPKLVFFFDEAHLLFKGAPKPLLDTIERVVRLIRSKGVGVYFVTQSPSDVPDTVLGQLGNRFQHALRAFTPKDQRAVKVAAETFRPNPHFDTKDEITNLGKGMALVSTLDSSGVPSPVEIVKMRPPKSLIGPAPGEYVSKISECSVEDDSSSLKFREDPVGWVVCRTLFIAMNVGFCCLLVWGLVKLYQVLF